MIRVHRSLPLLVAVSIIVSACGSDSNEADVPLVPSTVATSAPQSGPTTLADVDRLDPNDPGGFPRALVPGDAFAASEVVVEATPADVEAISLDLQIDGQIVIPVVIESCSLIAVWALPNSSALLVGYEEHPNIDCVRSVPRTAFFVIPTSGENSEGMWNYETNPAINLQRQTG